MIPLETTPAWQAILTFVGVIAVAVIAASVPWLTLRNERAIANAEADLWKKLPADDPATIELKRLIDARIIRWTRKAFKKDPATGKEVTTFRSLIRPLAALIATLALFLAWYVYNGQWALR